MRYSDLVQFDPIETVIQLREADSEKKAVEHVKTDVISDRMADVLTGVVIPQLQFEETADNKGILIVGNYGTGKSHLMSVISAIAQYPDILPDVVNPSVREAAQNIAGRFKVLRVEIGSVDRSLRDSLLEELEIALEEWGTPYHFPTADQVTNNKDIIIEAMIGFR